MADKALFKRCSTCSTKMTRTDGHSVCFECLGETHIVQKCEHCQQFYAEGQSRESDQTTGPIVEAGYAGYWVETPSELLPVSGKSKPPSVSDTLVRSTVSTTRSHSPDRIRQASAPASEPKGVSSSTSDRKTLSASDPSQKHRRSKSPSRSEPSATPAPKVKRTSSDLAILHKSNPKSLDPKTSIIHRSDPNSSDPKPSDLKSAEPVRTVQVSMDTPVSDLKGSDLTVPDRGSDLVGQDCSSGHATVAQGVKKAKKKSKHRHSTAMPASNSQSSSCSCA